MDKKVAALLNEQINKELYSAYLYLDMANFYASKGLDGFANWFEIQAREEQDHAMLIYKYLHNNSQDVTLEAIAKPDETFETLSDPFTAPYTAWEQVSPDRREALVSLVSGPTQAAAPFRALRLKGLNPSLRYAVNGEGAYPGDVLMEAGWPLPMTWGDYQSMQLYLSAL